MVGLLFCEASDWIDDRGIEMSMAVESKARDLQARKRLVSFPVAWPDEFSEAESAQMDGMLVRRVQELRNPEPFDDLPF